MSKKISPLRGTHDLLHEDCSLYSYILEQAGNKARTYAFEEIMTPIMEPSEVFMKTLGESSDIISKETYTFSDRDKRYITLRPEFTAAIVRAFLSNNMEQNLPVKLFTHGPVFRHERPQKCRYRQFHQLNFEYIGSDSPYADVETIELAYSILQALGITAGRITLKLNTLGDVESRTKHREALFRFLQDRKEQLSPTSQGRLEYNPLRVLDSKETQDREVVKDAPKILDYLNEDSLTFFRNVTQGLDALNIKYEIDHTLVRGLDYYTHTVFEMITPELGSQGTVIAGGRYDRLIQMMGGPDTPAFGFAAGVERLISMLDKATFAKNKTPSYYIVPIGEDLELAALKIARQLRAKPAKVYLEQQISLKKKMQRANKYQVDYALIFGKDELAGEVVKLKNMETGTEQEYSLESLNINLD